ncbi:MAG TPA: ribbon-helix-helix protein, CopG family [Polyangiaceae bacterium]|nr:ribbon-helix-helix protein, CopG family [Polyangiaceae bacterium]
MPEPHIGLRLDTEDRALLEACSKAEKLNKSDIIRRALRDYAKKLGVAAEPTRGRRKKK